MNQDTKTKLAELLTAHCAGPVGLEVREGGETTAQVYVGGAAPEDVAHVASVTKSVVSLLFGLALEQGKLQSVTQKVVEFFPEYHRRRADPLLEQTTLEQLLTMTAAFRYKKEPYLRFFTSRQPARDALEQLGGKGQAGAFRYAAFGGPQILSAVFTRATGVSLRQMAQKTLFEPLGICVEQDLALRTRAEHAAFLSDRAQRGWAADPQGLSWAGWGLRLSVADMAKLGQLALDGGSWQGRQLVPEQWLRLSTRAHVATPAKTYGGLAYGYLWWVVNARSGSFAAVGDGGNLIYANPARRRVLALTGAQGPKLAAPTQLLEPLEALLDAEGA